MKNNRVDFLDARIMNTSTSKSLVNQTTLGDLLCGQHQQLLKCVLALK
jgi:hypothetical protein